MHAHHSRHTHAHYVHTYDTMYAHVYTCTHCGRTGHLAHNSKFANKFVWVRKGTYPHGLRKIWVPKVTPIVFDAGVNSHTM